MIAAVELVARAVARARQGYQLIRSASPLAPDELPIFGFVPIKLVSEEIVQAIAFGDLNGPPVVVTRWNPLSRDASAFEAFATGLDTYVRTALLQNRLPRIWVPHEGALRQLELLGYRYRNNQRATGSLQRMGALCRAFMEEHQHEGQQVVAVASEILRRQIVTGQSPAEDAHLGALLAWIETAGRDPALEAARRSLVPAAAMLTRNEDDAVEALRPIAKKGGSVGARAQARIEQILATAALREWDLLLRARRAILTLGLLPISDIDELTSASRERVFYSLSLLPSPPSRTAALSRLLDELESSAERAEDANVEGDQLTRELLRRAGRVIEAVVESAHQPRRGCRPCSLRLFTDQPVLRVRPGTILRLVGTRLRTRVTSVSVEAARGGHYVDVEVTDGVRSRPGSGARADWTDSAPMDADFLRKRIYQAANTAAPAALTGDPLPLPIPRTFALTEDLGAIADALRTP
jgi:hypothetical protein